MSESLGNVERKELVYLGVCPGTWHKGIVYILAIATLRVPLPHNYTHLKKYA